MNDRSPFATDKPTTRRRITQHALLPDGTPNDSDRVEIGPTDQAIEEWQAAGLALPNLPALRQYRLGRLLKMLSERDYAGILLYDPFNIRYATDSSNMQIWTTHNAARACFVSASGHVVLWDFHGCDHLNAHLPLINEVRHGAGFYYCERGEREDEAAATFAAEIDELLREHAGNDRRLAVDKTEIGGIRALRSRGIDVMPGQEVTEHARKIKDDNELRAIRCALHACELAMHEMRRHTRPGLSEVALWAELQRGNHVRGGEFIETRLLSSGPRTNPWFQEAGPRVIREGEMLAFDTDMIGPYGYCADLSRTWKIGDEPASDYEKSLYRHAYEHIQTNMQSLKPGVSFRELTERAHRLDRRYRSQRYGVLMHGVGLCDEYPNIYYPEDVDAAGYDGVLEPGQCLCVEAYVGEVGGPCGVKLEDQVVITETGYENLTRFPFESRLLD